MIRTLVALLLLAANVPAGPAVVSARAHVLFRFADPRITEASGIAAGVISPGVVYVQNDSGDPNRFFAVNARTGATAATVIVHGARNVDWEDIAVAPDRTGRSSVWIADIGDNDAVRRSVQLYQVREPKINSEWRNRTVRVRVQREWQLRYPDGPVDAESLAVGPAGSAYILTKTIGGATVYRVPGWRPGVHVLRRAGRLSFSSTGTANPFGLPGQLMATGAAISPDGSLFVVRTYADAWVWRLAGSGLRPALLRPPEVVSLPKQPQGEGVAVAGGHLIIDSENAHSAVYSVALPRPIEPQRSFGVRPASLLPQHATGSNTNLYWIVGGIGVILAIAAIGVGLAARRGR